jgi:hypothetical protein
MDFMFNALLDWRRFRGLTVVNAVMRECLVIYADQGITDETVAAAMECLTFQRGTAPINIWIDNGPEFISRALDNGPI